MMTCRKITGLALFCCVVATTGCSRSPMVNFYTLSATAKTEAVKPVSTAYEVEIGPITLPEIVDRSQLVIQLKSSQVEILELHRWAEPLKSRIPRLIADNVGRLIGSDRVSAYPQSAGSEADLRVLVDIQRFETEGESVVIDALWTLRRKSGEVVKTGRSSAREAVVAGDYDSLVTAYSRALSSISSDIANGLRSEVPRSN